MDERKVIEQKYQTGQLESITQHLMDFVRRHRSDIALFIRECDEPMDPVEAVKHIVQRRGSIHLPSEMADQIKEINNEIWYHGERGDYNKSKIQEEWAMKYASMWRSFRIKEILYVVERRGEEIRDIVNGIH